MASSAMWVLCSTFTAVPHALGFRQQIGLPMLVSVPSAVSALSIQGPRFTAEPNVGTTKNDIFLPEEPVDNFSAVIAEHAKIAAEESRRLTRVGSDSAEGAVTSGPAQQQVGLPPFPDFPFPSTHGGGAKLFFLFITRSGVNHMGSWRAFFEGAPRDHYSLFMHCDNEADCQSQVSVDNNPLGIRVVPTAESVYCADLVSPMVQLLKYAKPFSAHPQDKFVFISETTLPVKPFGHIYQKLASDAKSDFCVKATRKWQRVTSAVQSQSLLLLKHSQWITLNTAHAQVVIDRWAEVKAQAEYWRLPMSDTPGKIASMEEAVSVSKETPLCADEFAVFGSIFGAIRDSPAPDQIEYEAVRGSPIQLNLSHDQGHCHTFVTFGSETGTETLWVARAINDDAGSTLSCFPCNHSYHPAAIERISDFGMLQLKNSNFLFARKFALDAFTEDQFQRVILGS